MTTRLDAPCTKCGSLNDAQSAPEEEDAVPEEGDFSICLYCGHVTAFVVTQDGPLGLRELTENEAAHVANDAHMLEMERIRQVVMGRARP